MKINILTVFALFTMACSSSTHNQLTQYELVESESSIILPLTSEIPPFSDCAYQLKLGNKDLYFYMGSKNDIVLYDISREEVLNRIELDIEGPNGIGELRGLTPSLDSSIYVLGRDTYEIVKINFDGKVIERYSFLNTVEHHPIASNSFPKNTIGGQIYIDQNILSFATLPHGNWSQLNASFLENYKLEAQLNMDTRNISFLPMTYPDEYYNEGDYHVYYNRVKVDDDYIYSFSTDHNIYKLSNGIIKSFDAKSAHMEYPMNKYLTGGIDEYLKSIIELQRYKHLVYDPYRKVYYRFAYLGDELSNRIEISGTLQEQIKYLSNLSILILDQDLNVVGETVLPYGKYLAANYLIMSDGLYLSTNNPSNQYMSEDQLKFQLFELSPRE